MRMGRACLNCKRKKVRCDGGRPVCGFCVRLGQDCAYAATTSPSTAGQLPCTSTEGRRTTSLTGRSLIALTNHEVKDASRSETRNSSVPPVSTVIWSLVDSYFRCSHNQPYSFFHEVSFRNDLLNGLLPDYLVLAVLATAVRFSCGIIPADREDEVAQGYSSKAWSQIIDQGLGFEERPIVDHRLVQALTILSIQDFVDCRKLSAWIKIGIAVRLAQAQNLMFDPDHSLPLTRQEEKRRTYWSLYLLDRLTTCARGRPASIQDYSCQLRLPCSEEAFNTHMGEKTLTLAELEKHPSLAIERYSVGALGQVVLVAAELHRTAIYMIQRYNQDNCTPPWDPQSEFSAIHARLLYLETQFEYWKPVHEAIQQRTSSRNNLDAYTIEPLIFAHALFHLCHCLLQQPFLLRCHFEAHSIKFHARFFSNALKASWKHAQLLTTTLQSAKAQGNMLNASFLGYCALVAGSINSLHQFSDINTVGLQSTKSLADNVAFLQGHSTLYKNSKTMLQALERLSTTAWRYHLLIDVDSHNILFEASDVDFLYSLLDYATMSASSISSASAHPCRDELLNVMSSAGAMIPNS